MPDNEKVLVSLRDDLINVDGFTTLIITEEHHDERNKLRFAVCGFGGTRLLVDELLQAFVARLADNPKFEVVAVPAAAEAVDGA